MPGKIPWHKPHRAPGYIEQQAREKARRKKAQPRDDNAPATMPGRKSPLPSDRRWRRFRLSFLARHPTCQDCEDRGIATAATEVHHMVKRTDDPDGAHWFDPEHCRALCKSCHSSRTGRGE